MNGKPNTHGNLPQLTRSNFSYWYDALEIHARTIDAQNELTNAIPATADPAQQHEQRKKEDQLRKAIMQSVGTEVVQLLPPHILRHEPHTICTMVKQAIDTCSIENHELLDAEARTLTYTLEQELSDYVQKHRELRHRMQVSGYPNIDAERTTVRYMEQGLAHHPDMHALAMMLACNPRTPFGNLRTTSTKCS